MLILLLSQFIVTILCSICLLFFLTKVIASYEKLVGDKLYLLSRFTRTSKIKLLSNNNLSVINLS